jgi:hypothetical protein
VYQGLFAQFPSGKAAETAHLNLAKANNDGTIPQYIFMAWCSVKQWDNFTFALPNK